MLLDPILLTEATRILIITTDHIINLGVDINNKKSGAIFCQVWKTHAVIFDNLVINGAPQKCSGASLIFSNSAMVIHIENVLIYSMINLLAKIIKDPILCTRKYIIPIFFPIQLYVIKGMKDIKFTSIINHTVGHLSVDILPSVPINKPVHIKCYHSFRTKLHKMDIRSKLTWLAPVWTQIT